MISDWERRQADRFYADLIGVRRGSRLPRRGSADEADPCADRDLRTGRVIFYDEDTLRYIEGWTRDTGSDDVFLVNRSAFDPIRSDGRLRSRQYDDYLRRSVRGERDLMPPLYVM